MFQVEVGVSEETLLQTQAAVVYDGEEYSRESLQGMVSSYQEMHTRRIKELEGLKKTHDEIAKEMTRDLAESKSAWDCL